jgi:protein phosphatase
MNAMELAATDAASATDTGQIRVANQDSWGAFTDADSARLFVVADGMGGHRGGETASRIAVETIGEVFRRSEDGPDATLRGAFEAANQRIWETAQQDDSLHGMGTTGVALLLCPGGPLWLAHVGDSRAYRFRRGVLERLTVDHSMVEHMREHGLITEEEAAHHPDRNVILRSLGVLPTVEIDIAPVATEPGDQFLLCSDGLSSVVPEEEIAAVLGRNRPADAARLLVDLANQRGGPDNVTVQVVQLPGGEAPPRRTQELRAARPPLDAARSARGSRLERSIPIVATACIAVGVALVTVVLWWMLSR